MTPRRDHIGCSLNRCRHYCLRFLILGQEAGYDFQILTFNEALRAQFVEERKNWGLDSSPAPQQQFDMCGSVLVLAQLAATRLRSQQLL